MRFTVVVRLISQSVNVRVQHATPDAYLDGIELACVRAEADRNSVGVVWAKVKGYPWWPVRCMLCCCFPNEV